MSPDDTPDPPEQITPKDETEAIREAQARGEDIQAGNAVVGRPGNGDTAPTKEQK